VLDWQRLPAAPKADGALCGGGAAPPPLYPLLTSLLCLWAAGTEADRCSREGGGRREGGPMRAGGVGGRNVDTYRIAVIVRLGVGSKGRGGAALP
jgi:hypothetical protein